MNTEILLKFRVMAAILHLLGSIPIVSIPITWILWITTQTTHPFIDRSGKSALNFQASVITYIIVATLLLSTTCGILSNLGQFGQSAVMMIGYPILFLMPICFAIVFTLPIAAAILAMLGKVYSYPLTIKFISEEQ
jgi:uncharacterized protein